MYIRKIVQSGLASFTVALPKEWIVKQKLDKGDIVYITETTEGVLISADQKQKKKIEQQVILETAGKNERSLRRDIIGAYLNNVHQVTIKGNIAQYAKMIKETESLLVGLEIIDEDAQKIVMRNFIHFEDMIPEQVIRRIDNIVRSMILDAKNIHKDETLVEAIRLRDKTVNRFVFLLLKVIRAGTTDPSIATQIKLNTADALIVWELIQHLEKIGDGIKRMGENIAIIVKKGKNTQDMQHILDRTYELYLAAMKSYYQKHIESSDFVSSERDKVNDLANTFIQKNNTVEGASFASKIKGVLSHINDITRFARYV